MQPHSPVGRALNHHTAVETSLGGQGKAEEVHLIQPRGLEKLPGGCDVWILKDDLESASWRRRGREFLTQVLTPRPTLVKKCRLGRAPNHSEKEGKRESKIYLPVCPWLCVSNCTPKLNTLFVPLFFCEWGHSTVLLFFLSILHRFLKMFCNSSRGKSENYFFL